MQEVACPSHERPSQQFFRNLAQQQIPSLGGVRGIAAYTVVLSHSVLRGGFGTLAVNVFFVLSGFLITQLFIKEYEKRGNISLRNFYLRRTLRIFPAFYTAWAFTVAVALATGVKFSWLEAAAAFFYLGDYYHALRWALSDASHKILLITWSLGIEEKYYLLWPIFLGSQIGSWSSLYKFCCGVIVSVWLYRAALVNLTATPIAYAMYAFDTRVDLILIGCAIALLVSTPVFGHVVDVVAGRWLYPWATLMALIASQLLLGEGVLYHSLGIPVQGLLIACLLVQLITWGHHRRLRYLSSKPMLIAGDLSYSIYLYHVPVAMACTYFLHPFRWRYQLLASLLLPVVVAFLSYYGVERPFLRLKTRLGHY